MGKRILAFIFTAFLMGMLSEVCFAAEVYSAAEGWKQEDGEWHYYENGHIRIGWIKKNGEQYYFDTRGRMVTGWEKIGGSWYFFKADGTMHRGWYKENGNWYYLKIEDGSMLSDKTGPDGHWMDEEGVWKADAVDSRAEVLRLTGELPYILNWETDSRGGFIGNGVADLSVVKSLLGMQSYDELDPKEKEVYDIVKAFIDSEIKETDTDYEKIVKITRFIWDRAEYIPKYQGDVYGILIEGGGVCDGYANTFKMIANVLGFECYKAESGYYNHVWNIVKVDGEWYNADLTEPEGVGYPLSEAEYILRSDSDYIKSQYKTGSSVNTPGCTATRYTKSTLKK